MICARLKLFGKQSLTIGPTPHGEAVDLHSVQIQILLAYLSLHTDQPIDRRKLAFILWPDTTEAGALRNLRQHLHRLRQILASLSLPDQVLLSQGGQLYFNPASYLWIDVLQFQRQINNQGWQIEAIELYEGDLLAAQSGIWPEYAEAWLEPIRMRLKEDYLTALHSQISVANMQRNYPRALYYAKRLLQASPLRESSHRTYMQALYFKGERIQALQHFAKLKALLKRELKAKPMPETVELHRQMQNGTLAEAMPPVTAAPRPMAKRLQQTGPIGQSLLGRTEAVTQLDDALALALNGWGRFMLLQGEGGLGKTYLLQKWQQARAEMMLTFKATCLKQEEPVPHGPVLMALRQGYDQIDWKWFPANFPWLIKLRQILQQRVFSSTDAHLSPHVLGQFVLALASRANRPLCLMLDDLHNAEDDIWQLLTYWGRRCTKEPFLLVGTYRPGALSATAQRLLNSLLRYRQVHTPVLRPLSFADTAKLAGQFLKQAQLTKPFLNRLYWATEGNPFFISEYLKAVQSESNTSSDWPLKSPPKTVQAAIDAHLNQLSGTEKALLSIAAAIGATFQFDILTSVAANFSENQALSALETWLDRGLVLEQSDVYQFSHEQIRWVAYQNLDPALRPGIHRLIAEVLAALPPGSPLRSHERLTFHQQKARAD